MSAFTEQINVRVTPEMLASIARLGGSAYVRALIAEDIDRRSYDEPFPADFRSAFEVAVVDGIAASVKLYTGVRK